MVDSKRRLTVDAGPFYLEADCCIMCGVPAATAPTLFGEGPDTCFIKRQPADACEVDRMLLAMINADIGCIRYAGSDPAILRRLAEQGEGALADNVLDERIAKVERNVAGLRTLHAGGAQDLADAFIAHLRREPVPERFKFAMDQASAERCALRVSWYTDNYRRLTIERSRSTEFDFVITGLPFMVAEWIRDDAIGEAVFFEEADWKSSRSRGTRVPW